MRWFTTSHLPACLLSAAAAAALATPLESWAQIKPANGAGVRKPAAKVPAKLPTGSPDSNSGQILQVQNTAPAGGETDVQRELRRLYEESGREMPETPRQIQTQRPAAQPQAVQQSATEMSAPQGVPAAVPRQPASTIAAPNPGAQAGAGGAAPAPSAPKPKPGSRNPVVSFFKRITGQGQSKPAPTAAPSATTRPTAPPVQAAAPPTRSPQANYAPYSGQQPRRLTNNEIVQTPPPAPAAPSSAQLPPPPAQFPVVTATKTPPAAPVLQPPVAASVTAAPLAPVPVAKAPPTRPADGFNPFEEPESPTRTAAAPLAATGRPAALPLPTEDEEPEFAPPLIVEDSTESPFNQTLTETAPEIPNDEEPAFEPAVEVAKQDFPDPFPEMSEMEADDELDIELETPFAGLKLDEEPEFGASESAESVAQTTTPAAEEDPFADLPAVAQTPAELPMPEPAVASTAPMLETPGMPETPSLEVPEESDPFTAPLEVATEDKAPLTVPTPETPALDVPAPATTAPAPVATTTEPGPADAKPISAEPQTDTDAKMALIRERGGMKGLKGFCPVTLRDDRELLDAQQDFYSSYRGQKFHFATAVAKDKFDADPQRYVPAAYGADVVVLIRDKDVAEGSLDFAAWYKGKLYLFSRGETHDTFVADPAKYAAPAGLE